MTLSLDIQDHIESLAGTILRDYGVKSPPVPIEKILTNPPGGLEAVDIRDMSLVFGVGEHRYEYRLALGRLLYRELCRTGFGTAAETAALPTNSDAARHFAMAVLMPAAWLRKAARRRRANLHDLSLDYQVPDYAMATRLVQLGYRVKGMD